VELYQTVKILKIKGNVHENVRDRVIKEAAYKLYINNQKQEILYCTPEYLKELVVGRLFEKGLIRKIDDILSINIDDEIINIKLKEEIARKQFDNNTNINDDKDNLFITPKKVFRIIKTLTDKSSLFKETGGTHNALLSNIEDNNLIFREDVSRNNTVNKIIGNIIISNNNPGDKILAVSSRVSYIIMKKIAKIGIPIVISVSAPTDRAIKMADRTNITLIAFVRGEKMNVYTKQARIIEKGR